MSERKEKPENVLRLLQAQQRTRKATDATLAKRLRLRKATPPPAPAAPARSKKPLNVLRLIARHLKEK